MSSRITEWEGWRRAFTSALRTFSYFVGIYVIVFIIIILPASIMVSQFGMSNSVNQLAGFISIILMFFGFILSFFKVLDEDRPGIVPLEMSH